MATTTSSSTSVKAGRRATERCDTITCPPIAAPLRGRAYQGLGLAAEDVQRPLVRVARLPRVPVVGPDGRGEGLPSFRRLTTPVQGHGEHKPGGGAGCL